MDYKIWIVEDDPVIAGEIARSLTGWGYNALIARDFAAIDAEARAVSPDLILMDVSLPSRNGFYWCQKIRENSAVPVIFLSSRGENSDVVNGINMGGDDYLTKPVSMDVLIAKVQAMLRRAYRLEAAPAPTIGEMRLQEGALEKDGVRIPLTRNEERILQLLAEKRGRVVSREALMLKLWNSDEFVDENTLTVNVNRLRRKLSEAGLADAIVTRKGQGYVLNA